tara:strand:- start:105 stop:845 length:741 start_codon:yes stop_codon:yes gene_type:complete
MRYKTGLNLAKIYSQNFTAPKRKKKYIKFIIIHYTGMKKESDAIKRLCNPNSKVSAHYFIKNNGQILILVPETYIAWHAGKSSWKSYKSLNKYSIGIEISNPGHTYNYKNFSNKQIASVKRLVKFLIKKYNIKVENLLGHSDIAPSRKVDPGEKFPWKKLSKYQLCKWHKLDPNYLKKSRNKKLSVKDSLLFFKNLYKIGYNKIKDLKLANNNKLLTQAFQRRYRQELVNGKTDKECLLISKNLLK